MFATLQCPLRHPPLHVPCLFFVSEQEVVNDIWRVVNLAYVDPTFNGQDWKAVRLKVLLFCLKIG